MFVFKNVKFSSLIKTIKRKSIGSSFTLLLVLDRRCVHVYVPGFLNLALGDEFNLLKLKWYRYRSDLCEKKYWIDFVNDGFIII